MTANTTIPAGKRAAGVRQLVPLSIGEYARYQRDAVGYLMEGRRRYGDVFRMQLGPLVIHLVSHPDHVQHVLGENAENFQRGPIYRVFEAGVGRGLITTEGVQWAPQRRMANPGFDQRRLACYAQAITDSTRALLTRWEARAATGAPFDVVPELSDLTMRILSRAILGVEIPDHTDARGRALETMREFANYAVVHLAPPPPFPTRRNLELRRALRTFHHFFDPLVRQRRAEGRDHGDLLSGLLQARDEETGTTLSDRQVGDNVLSYFMAAHEPIALTLAWALHLLARHPAECERLRAEAAGAADPARLPYTRMVLEETLRLYPSVWMFTRNAQRRDTIGGYDIPAGSIVFLSPFVTHRHPEAWPEPEAFRPERFSPEARAAHHPFGYFPFAAGPHECIGRHFAMMAMQMILPTLVRHFHFRAVGGEVGVEAVVTVRPRGGVRVSLESIHEAAHVAAVPLTV